MITAYGVAERLRLPPIAEGIGSVPVEILRHRALALAVSRHASPPARSRDAILAHAAVCDDLMAKADAVLPVRFGEVFEDDAALRSSVDDHYDQLVGGLEHVRGRVEIGVRVRWDEGGERPAARPPDRAAGGRSYLMFRLAEDRERQALEARAGAVAGRMHEAVVRHAADGRMQVLPTPGLVMSGAYLVDRDDVDRFVARITETAREHPDLEVLCTGPWPPYSFVDREDPRAS